MTVRLRLPSRRRPAADANGSVAVIPPDPRLHLPAPLDPPLDAIRASLAPHRRRLWFRRIVRRAWVALAAVAIAEVVLWTVARIVPIESAPVIGCRDPRDRAARPARRGGPLPTLAGRDRLGRRRRRRAGRSRLERARACRRVPGVRRTGDGSRGPRCTRRRSLRRGGRDRPLRPAAATGRPGRAAPDPEPVQAATLAVAGVRRAWRQPRCSCRSSSCRTHRTRSSPSSATSARPPTGRPIGSTSWLTSSTRRGARPKILERSWPRSCASSPANCARSRRSSPRTCASSARSRAGSVPASTRPRSSGRRR